MLVAANVAAMDEAEQVERVDVGQRGIRLGQLLKLVGLVESGGAVRELLASGAVTVNGETEVRRGRQLAAGDVVAGPGRRLTLE